VGAVSLGGITNLDYTVLLCNSMAATRAFYRDIMQFPIETDQENWVSFRVGAALLTLRPRGPWSVCDDGKSVPGYGECAGRPARSRWWKSTAMKE
jgi:catechol 2,3-dioxygenase-like lactoylglutathione lyase family enzyme